MSDALLLARLLQARDVAVFERLPNQTFHPVIAPPAWLTTVFEHAPPGGGAALGTALPFLDDFLPQAERVWLRPADGQIESGPFTVDAAGEELLLRASACAIDGRALLVLERLTGDADVRSTLRKARERMLEAETLARQVSTLHAPAAAIDREVAQLAAMPLADHQPPIVERLKQANEQLRKTLIGLPKPPQSTRR